MARYDREFLVPYLQDICTLHLAERKLKSRSWDLAMSVEHYTNGQALHNPDPPYEEPAAGKVTLCLIAAALPLGLAVFLNAKAPGDAITGFLGFILSLIGILMVVCAFINLIKIGEANEKRKEKYNLLIAEDKVTIENNKAAKAKVAPLQRELDICNSDLQQVETLLQHAYDANVIPRQYRDMYTAIYLYDFFSTGRSDDLDMALGLYMLEQIKDKLDTIIENQTEMLLNQRMILANQQRSMEDQQAYAARMEAKVNRLTQIEEERNQYYHMIESNTAATAYFAAADYIRRI